MRLWTVKQVNSSHYYSDVIIAEENSSDIGYECIADVWSTDADAQLLAAAPELLERLKEVVALLDEFLCDGETKEAEALIQRLEADSNA